MPHIPKVEENVVIVSMLNQSEVHRGSSVVLEVMLTLANKK